jgi:tetratricopeptide (TPR) repeat protein
MGPVTSTNAVTYEAIQRVFRNAVVTHIRDRLTECHGSTDAAARLVKAFPSWSAIKASAAESARTGIVGHPHADEFSYLDVSHFTALFNNEFEALVDVGGLPPEVVGSLKRQVVSYLREIKTVRDPVSHPGDEDLDPYDALRAVDNALRVARILELLEAVQELEAHRHQLSSFAADLSASLSSDSADDGLLPDEGLPPRDTVVVEFVGRRQELGHLREWLVDRHAKRWLLTGDGGKGKSAIAYQLATEVARRTDLDFAAVQWLSAKRRRFAEGADIEIASPDFSDLESAVDRLLAVLGWSEHVSKPLDTKQILLCQLVGEFPCFLVIDDIDSLEESQEDAIEFLVAELPAAGAKVLLTSRRNILGMGKSSTVVKGLSEAEANEFITSRLAIMGMDPALLTARQQRRIIRLSEGSPLYLEDILRLCTFLPVEQALSSWEQNAGSNVRRYALERELELLSATAREVLEVSCVVKGALTAVEAQHLLGRSEDAILAGLSELRQHHLVPAPELVEGIPRFIVNGNLRLLVLSTLEGTERGRKLKAAVVAVSGGAGSRSGSRAIADYRRQAEVLSRAGQLVKAEETLQRGLEQHPNQPRLYAALGTLYFGWRPQRVVDARAAWQRAYELGAADWRMYMDWSRLEQEQEEWQLMREAAERGLERIGNENSALLQRAGYAASRLGQSLASSFTTTRAEQEFARSDEFLRRAIETGKAQGVAPYFISRSYRAWIINAQAQGDDAEITRRLRSWLEWNPADPGALDEAERQRRRIPEVARLLERLLQKETRTDLDTAI